MVGASGATGDAAISRDVVVDGERRFDLRVTLAWVEGLGLMLWAYYGLEAMEIPKKTYLRMLRANFDHPFVKFAMTDDDRPMLMTELPARDATLDDVGRALVRLAIVADRLLEETAPAVADRGNLPETTGRLGRNAELLATYRAEVEGALPAWEGPPPPKRRRRGPIAWLRGGSR